MSSKPPAEVPAGTLERTRTRRPALWVSLLVFSLGLAGLVVAQQHDRRLEAHYDRILERQASLPYRTAKIRGELASMELTADGLEKELGDRLFAAKLLASDTFYITIDTVSRKLRLQVGKTIAREADLTVGDPRVIKAGGKSYEFVPLEGAFTVTGKLMNYPWRIPSWVYPMSDSPIPADPQTVKAGLGKYVITLPNGYVIHSPPSPESPLKGPKPGSFMVAEKDLEAIWPRVTKSTRVYINEVPR